MKVALGTFACSGIRAFLGVDIATGVQMALGRYAERTVCAEGTGPEELESMRKAIPCPSEDWMAHDGVPVELALDPELEAALERESRSGGASVDRIVAHAVLAYLADLDRVSEPDARTLTLI